ncbi:MAG TPA: EAL domain-containing protein [Steroidobacteraceae bacterium]|nr:EAL domain-containing protein [Steroidobacteraceae bacterium]
MEQELRLLLLEDTPAESELIVRHLKRAGLSCTWERVDTEAAFKRALRELQPHVILSDFSLPQYSGLEALALSNREARDTPFIFVSGTIGEERAIEVLKHGAVDYVLKSNLARLPAAITRAVEEAAAKRAQRRAEDRIARLTRVLQMLSSINSAVVRIRDRTELLQEACRIAHDVGNYVTAFVALCDPATGEARAIAWAGAGVELREQTHFRFLEGQPGDLSLTAHALRFGKTSIWSNVASDAGNDVHRKTLLGMGIRCVASLPLVVDNTPVGAVTVGASEADAVGSEELQMLQEVASNLSFALQYLHKEDAVRFLSYFDPQTALAKRTLFCERLTRKLAHRGEANPEVVVVVFDIERLGVINDSFGRHTGDLIVQCVADALKHNFGDSDSLAHLDGGTFAAMISGRESYEDAVRLLHDRISAALTRPLNVSGRDIPVTIKAGLARFPENGADAESLLQNAEAALHRARQSGERYLRYRREMNSEVAERLALEQRLHVALAQNQFELHYQPKLSIATGAIVGAEALLRWRDPTRGLTAPGVFLPVLESTGLILDVGEWVLHRAAEDLRRWHRQGLKSLRVAVNVSPLQLRERDFVARFFAAAGRGLRGSCGLDVEITEGALLGDALFLTRTLQVLRDEGVGVAIDDFGTGYSSLSRLSELPVDTLKIDRSFTSRLVGDKTAQAVVSTIVSLARAFELNTVAEGVETREQLAVLAELGCEQSQGYLHAKPLPAAEFERLLSADSDHPQQAQAL